jgi:anti-anti-sigma regulatory factor
MSEDGEVASVALPVRFELAELPALLAAIAAARRTCRRLALDGDGVESIDPAAIQLLCALTAAAARGELELEWTAVSPTIVTLATRLGAFDYLGLAKYPQSGLEWF